MVDTRQLIRLVIVLASAAALPAEGTIAMPQIRSLNGPIARPLALGRTASVVFFVATDCPVSNSYAPEIQRVCRDYAQRGIACSLIYEDVDTHESSAELDRQVRHHLAEYGYAGMHAAIDRDRTFARFAKASVTPQAVVADGSGRIRYRGRIDNLYAAFGKTRQQVTSHDLRDALDAVIAGRAVAHPETEALGCFIVDPAVLRKHEHE